jgi:hypothetical protein
MCVVSMITSPCLRSILHTPLSKGECFGVENLFIMNMIDMIENKKAISPRP